MKINYKLLMDEELLQIAKSGKKPKLLLHACCAPCSSAVLELLKDCFEITLFFYNPNIYPAHEFNFRLEELKRLVNEMGLTDVKIVSPEYDNSEFEAISDGLEDLPEGGARCAGCYSLRLSKTVDYAAQHGFDYVTTTLSISPHKNASLLNETGLALCADEKVKYLCSDFKKGEGYKRSCALSREYNLYRQNYCGCIYSKQFAEKAEEKLCHILK